MARQQVRAFALHPIITGLIYIGVLMFAHGVFVLCPLRSIQLLSSKSGSASNRTPSKTFILDLIKGTALSIAVGAPLLAGVLAIFQYGGTWAWLYCWIGVTIFTLLIQFVAPVWIMPLFNKFTPLADGELLQRIRSYSESVHFPLQGVFVMDGSKRSGKSNAFFTGFGRHKRIALYDTLIEKHTDGELVKRAGARKRTLQKETYHKKTDCTASCTWVYFFSLFYFLRHSGMFAAFYVEEVSTMPG